MAFEFSQDTPFGIPATYHRIVALHFYLDDNAGEIVFASYVNAEMRAAGKVAGNFKVALAPGVIRNPDTELTRAELYKIAKGVNPALRNAKDV